MQEDGIHRKVSDRGSNLLPTLNSRPERYVCWIGKEESMVEDSFRPHTIVPGHCKSLVSMLSLLLV